MAKWRDALLGEGGLKACRRKTVILVRDNGQARQRLDPVTREDGTVHDPDAALEVADALHVGDDRLPDDELLHDLERDGMPTSKSIVETVICCTIDPETGGPAFSAADTDTLLQQPANTWPEQIANVAFALAKPPDHLGK